MKALVILLTLIMIAFCSDFMICEAIDLQNDPDVLFADSLFYAFWVDFRFSGADLYSIYGARITPEGDVLDPGGKLIFVNKAETKPAVAYDSTNLLVVLQDSC